MKHYFRRGQVVEVEFLDHAYEYKGSAKDPGPIRFKVWGKVTKVNKLYVTVRHWDMVNPPTPADAAHNAEQASVLRSAILFVRYF